MNHLSIIIMEDEEVIRDVLKEILSRSGFNRETIFTTKSGEEAIEIIKQNNYIDILLTDINIAGGMDGDEMLLNIQKDPELNKKVNKRYIMTGNVKNESLLNSSIQYDLFLKKTFSGQLLIDHIRQDFERKQA